MLDRAAQPIERPLRNEPEVRASLERSIRRVYKNLALYDDAGRPLRGARTLRRTVRGGSGAGGRGEKLFAEAIAIRRAKLPAGHPIVAGTEQMLAECRRMAGSRR
ncbi:MAG: hypothetical protein R2729_31385 [Bryobacteraceae bacterium]